MVFSSTVFLFMFLPLVILIYYNPLLNSRGFKNYFLLLASLMFYAWGEPIFVFLMLASIGLTWYVGLKINSSGNPWYLRLGIIYHIVVLFIFKYLDFVAAQLNRFAGLGISVPDISLPIGISFFTFQLMSYLFDIHVRRAEPQRNPLMVGLYVALFPQLIAGPIVRYDYVANQLLYRQETVAKFAAGMERFVIGLGKKVLLADYLALLADAAFDNVQGASVSTAWLGAIAYTLQIYFDFSGYSDMAIGLGKMFGFEFAENFNYPYLARTVTEFWRRWHISLSSWFRDYVYVPLGGNRVGRVRWVMNFSAVWILTGVWHGAKWTFIIWGLLYLVVLLFEKIAMLDKHPNVLTRLYCLVIVVMAWVVFRAPNVTEAILYWQNMFCLTGGALFDALFWQLLASGAGILLLGLVGSTQLMQRVNELLCAGRMAWMWQLYLMVIFLLSIMRAISSTYSPFIYFNF